MQVLLDLCRFRNAHPAFNGTFDLVDLIDAAREIAGVGDRAAAASCAEVRAGWLSEVGVAAASPDRNGQWCVREPLA